MSFQGTIFTAACRAINEFVNAYKQGDAGYVVMGNTGVDMNSVAIYFDYYYGGWVFEGIVNVPSSGSINQIVFYTTLFGHDIVMIDIRNLDIPVNQGDRVYITISTQISEPNTITFIGGSGAGGGGGLA